jgi:hypothetical protein
MNVVQRAVGVLVALAVLAGIAALSRVPYATHDADRALLRLSWRARGERIESCRRATPAELANVPAHMRREVICEGVHVAPYRLRVTVDGRTLADGVVAGSGVAGDRPIYLLREFELRPGLHHLTVAFEKQSNGGDDRDDDPQSRGPSEREHERDARRGTVPPRLTVDTSLTILPGSVVLVTYDSERRRLDLLGGR